MSLIDPSELAEHIQQKHDELGYTKSWRFLYGPWSALKTAEVGFWGYNPGGDEEEQGFPKDNRISVEVGTAWTHEKWPSQLQKQVRRLFDELIQCPIEQAITGNIVPFRSQDMKSFYNKTNAESFSLKIWREILEDHCPKLCIANGMDAAKLLVRIQQAQKIEEIPSGWGSCKISLYRHAKGALVSMPHLSRFKILLNDKYIENVRQIIIQAKSL